MAQLPPLPVAIDKTTKPSASPNEFITKKTIRVASRIKFNIYTPSHERKIIIPHRIASNFSLLANNSPQHTQEIEISLRSRKGSGAASPQVQYHKDSELLGFQSQRQNFARSGSRHSSSEGFSPVRDDAQKKDDGPPRKRLGELPKYILRQKRKKPLPKEEPILFEGKLI